MLERGHLLSGCALLRPSVADYPAGARMPLRVIDDYEFVWMLRGVARFVTEHDERPLPPGHLLLVPPGVPHGFVWDDRRPSRHGYVHFGPGHVDTPVAADVRLVRMTPEDPLAGLCAYLLWLGRGDHQPQLRRTLDTLVTVVTAGPLPVAGSTVPPALKHVVAHLRERWAGPPLPRTKVDDLAAAANLSRGYVNRLFTSAFGLSAARALELVRCGRAETLLTWTDLTVAAIAHQCGFADVSHFSHRFTAVHGVAPSAYRVGPRMPSVLEHPGVRVLTGLLWD
jgi:AraC-like DNA-binding protein